MWPQYLKVEILFPTLSIIESSWLCIPSEAWSLSKYDNIRIRNIKIQFLSQNFTCFQYKYHSIYTVQWNNRCLFGDSTKPTYTLCGQSRKLPNVKAFGNVATKLESTRMYAFISFRTSTVSKVLVSRIHFPIRKRELLVLSAFYSDTWGPVSRVEIGSHCQSSDV